jgi:hypothetical protein
MQTVVDILSDLHRTDWELAMHVDHGAFSWLWERKINLLTHDERQAVREAKEACRRSFDERTISDEHNANTERYAALRREILARFPAFVEGYIEFWKAGEPLRQAQHATYEAMRVAREAEARAYTTYRKTYSTTAEKLLQKARTALLAAESAWTELCANEPDQYRALRKQYIPVQFQID